MSEIHYVRFLAMTFVVVCELLARLQKEAFLVNIDNSYMCKKINSTSFLLYLISKWSFRFTSVIRFSENIFHKKALNFETHVRFR